MCGIVGVLSHAPVNQLIYDALLLLQHRGQDAAGIVTMQGTQVLHAQGARHGARRVPHPQHARAARHWWASGQVRYPTAGNAFSEEEAQPFYVNAPYGIVLVHNGNLTNAAGAEGARCSQRTTATSTPRATPRCCINVLAHELDRPRAACPLDAGARCSRAVAAAHRRLKGSYAVVALIAGPWLLAFRDPYGIRPLCFGRGSGQQRATVMVASESVALEGTGHRLDARRGAGRGHLHRPARAACTHASAPSAPRSNALHLRVRVPGAAGLGDGRHLASTRRA
jgi:amidophosphoribosyltransferase